MPMRSRSYGRFARIGFLWGMGTRAAGEFLAIPTAMITARLLSPTEFGIAAAAGFCIQLAARLTNVGFNIALVQIKELRPEHSSSVFVAHLVLGLAAWTGLWAGAPYVAQLFGSPDVAAVLPIAASTFFIGAFGSVPAALLMRELRFREASTADFSYTACVAVLSIAMAWAGYGYWSLVYGQVIGTIVQTGLRLWYAKWRPTMRFSRAAIDDLLVFGFGLYFKRLLESGAQNLDNLVVGSTLGITGLGLYDKAFSTMNRAVVALSTTGPTVSFRILSIIHEDHNRFRLAYRKLLLTATLIGYPALTLAISVAPELFYLMFGPQWSAAVVPFQLLCVAGMAKLAIAYASTAIQSKGRVWSEVGLQIGHVALIVGGVAAGSRFGVAGAAGGALAATALMGIFMHGLLLRVAGLGWRDVVGPQVPAITCSAGLALILMGLPILCRQQLSIHLDAAWQLFAVKAIAGAVFYLLFIAFSGFAGVRALVREAVADLPPWAARLAPPSIGARA